jgi:hypothetical protein
MTQIAECRATRELLADVGHNARAEGGAWRS